jgi:hypothetical protein
MCVLYFGEMLDKPTSLRLATVFGVGGQPPSCQADAQQKGLPQDANLSYLSRRNETAIYNGIVLVTNRSRP